MLEELLKREDVNSFIKILKNNDRYFDKEFKKIADRKITVGKELALYIFYESLYKFQLLFEDVYMFDEYMIQLDRLYKRIDNFDDIEVGINKLLCKLLTIKLDIKDEQDIDSRREIIEYVYDKYIVDGYYIHGFNTSYTKEILEKGFNPEEYQNYYDKFSKLNKIFAKYNVINIIDKDFTKKEVTFTDNFLMACYYSTYGPNFFSKFLKSEDYFGRLQKQDGYLIDDYNLTISRLKRFMDNNLFKEDDKKFILDLVKDEWDLLHREDKKISLLLVKRDEISKDKISLSEYINSDEDLYDVVDRLLSSKKNKIECSNTIPSDKLEIITLDTYYEKTDDDFDKEYEEQFDKYRLEQENKEFMDTYGSVSILLIAGSLLITLGVIVTIFMVIRGI